MLRALREQSLAVAIVAAVGFALCIAGVIVEGLTWAELQTATLPKGHPRDIKETRLYHAFYYRNAAGALCAVFVFGVAINVGVGLATRKPEPPKPNLFTGISN